MQHLSGRVAVVTGAASGIGAAMARRFARAGMNIVAADVDEAALADLCKELTATGHAAIGVRTDVSAPAAVRTPRDRGGCASAGRTTRTGRRRAGR